MYECITGIIISIVVSIVFLRYLDNVDGHEFLSSHKDRYTTL